MDGSISTRKYPSYTTAELEASVEYIKVNGKTRSGATGVDATMSMIAMEDEIDRRKAGVSVVRATPQIMGGKVIIKVGRL